MQTCAAQHLKKIAITHPQVSVITDVLLSLRYCGEPFQALQAFHTECVRKHFSVDVVRNIINRSLLLRLYLCAYQHPAIWRECWRYAIAPHAPHFAARSSGLKRLVAYKSGGA